MVITHNSSQKIYRDIDSAIKDFCTNFEDCVKCPHLRIRKIYNYDYYDCNLQKLHPLEVAPLINCTITNFHFLDELFVNLCAQLKSDIEKDIAKEIERQNETD